MTSSRIEQIIDEAEDAMGVLLALGARCDEDSWLRTSVAEGWSVAAVFHHVAAGNQFILGWLHQMRSGRPIEETWDDVHRRNAEQARRFADCERMPTLRLLRTVRDEAIEFLEGLADTDLERSSYCALNHRVLTVAEVAGWLAGHPTDHLDSLRAVLPARVKDPPQDFAGEARPSGADGTQPIAAKNNDDRRQSVTTRRRLSW